ncbi:MAG: Crp/Fnr family transcriptional regulator [Acidobacteriia bacterium]|nr:Crp/Fnr family transcriptional regulator [Terriglobia bacterium]
MFCNLPRPTLETLQTLGITTACPKGTVLYSQGQSPREISVLCLGYVKVSTASQTGRTVCLGIAEPGAVLGLSATISGKPYEVSIEALEPCQLKVISGDRFLNFLRNDRAACLAVLKCLSNDVRKAYEPVRLFGLSHSATEKLANVLLRWCMRDDRQPKNGIHLRFPLTQRELAQMLGTNRETAGRALRTLERKRIIQCHGSSLVIQDERTLRLLSPTGYPRV